jgi:hypothetical protein
LGVYDAGDVATGAIKKKMGMIFIHYSQSLLFYVTFAVLISSKLHQSIEYYTHKYYFDIPGLFLSENNSFIEPFFELNCYLQY